MVPQQSRHLAIASGSLQCAATTVETYLTWNASGVPIKQIVQLDKSYGADGIAVRGGINKVADLKGKPSVSMHQEPPPIFCWPGSSIKTA
jgi:NitT/TauT family transport system substrate-binding protein